MNQPQAPNLNSSTPIICTSCNGRFFQSAIMFRKISKLLTATTQDAIIPIETFRCMDCGEVLSELLPTNLPND